MNVQYVGPSMDYSGYGEACRHDIGALMSAGVDVTCKIPRYTNESTDYGHLGEIVAGLEDRELGYKIKIIHTTPDQFQKYHEPGKYNIGRVIWETDRLPPVFAENCELMDEIWTASEFNKQAIIRSGVSKPVFVIPEAIDADIDSKSIKPFKTRADNKYSFYSIFEWTERKNPDALLRAYWSEFRQEDNVCLVIKTYIDNFSVAKRQEITQAIGAIRAALGLDYYAPVYLYRDLLQRNQMYRFHKSFNCFVSTHRGEGWGIPQTEAMLMGKPIISTNVGGVHEYVHNNIDAYLLDYEPVPVLNTRNNQWYLHDQNWANVKVEDVRRAMRNAYDNQNKAHEVGKRAKENVEQNLSLNAVGKIMKDRLDRVIA
jgi:glycosyltransferase involved in cell wall biosynthesis